MNLKEGSCCVVNRGEDQTTIDFDGDINLVEKEVVVLSTAAVELEPMLMNLKEGDCYVVNHGEDLTTIDFGNYISLAKKEDAGIAGRGDPARDRRNRMDRAEVVAGQ
ncbi:hypothetical protein GW17_00056867 [Ensete ventricosum]|nr:hypothetical protein GW17_00056867 [Ensete ventricosum]